MNNNEQKTEVIIFPTKILNKEKPNKFNYIGKDIDGNDFTDIINDQLKLKYAIEHNGIVRGRLIKNNNGVLVYKFRAVKTKFIKSLKPKTLEEAELEENNRIFNNNKI